MNSHTEEKMTKLNNQIDSAQNMTVDKFNTMKWSI